MWFVQRSANDHTRRWFQPEPRACGPGKRHADDRSVTWTGLQPDTGHMPGPRRPSTRPSVRSCSRTRSCATPPGPVSSLARATCPSHGPASTTVPAVVVVFKRHVGRQTCSGCRGHLRSFFCAPRHIRAHFVRGADITRLLVLLRPGLSFAAGGSGVLAIAPSWHIAVAFQRIRHAGGDLVSLLAVF